MFRFSTSLFDQVRPSLKSRNFFRAHLSFFTPVIMAVNNDEIELRTKKVYALIHEFTDEESRKIY